MKESIYFYYTNDLHSYFNHWSQVATFIKSKKRERKDKNESAWTIDIGDHMDRVHPITEATMGKANVELLNDLGYDFATIGNNEGITLAHHQLYHLYDDAAFQVVCSNLESTISENPKWLHHSKIETSNNGVKIGFIGLTARFNPYYHLLGWNITPSFEAIENELQILKEETDIIVLLSHVGMNEDQAIAERFPEINLIIGGHTHHLLRTGEIVNETLLTAAGKHCAYVGEVRLVWDHESNRLIQKEAHTTNITHLRKDRATEQRLTELREEADLILNKKIISIDKRIEVNWYKETKIIKKLTEKLLEWTGAECAMLNAGLLIEEFQPGNITYKDVHRICPHSINPCVVTLNGNELMEVIRASLSKQLMELELKGFGFRGEVIGRIVFANLDVQTAFHKDGQEYVKKVLFNGMPIVSERKYKLATADMFTFGRLLPEIARSEVKTLFLPEFIREILVQTLLDYPKN